MKMIFCIFIKNISTLSGLAHKTNEIFKNAGHLLTTKLITLSEFVN